MKVRETGSTNQWKALIQSQVQQKFGAQELCNEVFNFILLKRQEFRAKELIQENGGQILTIEEEKERDLFDTNFGFDEPMSIEILELIQRYFENRYQIIAINSRSGDQLFVGPDADDKIFLLFTPHGRGHWDLIKEMKSYRNCAYYCIKCNKCYKAPQKHICNGGCKLCRHHTLCSPDDSAQHCNECNKTFVNIECFNRHIENKVCKYIKVCSNCEASYTKGSREHVCGEYRC
jgi:hypothetical protein